MSKELSEVLYETARDLHRIGLWTIKLCTSLIH